MARRDLDGNWGWQRPLLLVPPEAFSPRRRRLQLGRLGGAGLARSPQSLRPTHAAVSPDLRHLRSAFRLDAPRSRRRHILWNQLRPVSPWPFTLWLSSFTGISRLPVLGRYHRSAMGSRYYGQCVLPPSANPHLGKAAVGTSGRTHHIDLARSTGLRRTPGALTSGNARMAVAVGRPFLSIQLLRAPADLARPFARPGSPSLS